MAGTRCPFPVCVFETPRDAGDATTAAILSTHALIHRVEHARLQLKWQRSHDHPSPQQGRPRSGSSLKISGDATLMRPGLKEDHMLRLTTQAHAHPECKDTAGPRDRSHQASSHKAPSSEVGKRSDREGDVPSHEAST